MRTNTAKNNLKLLISRAAVQSGNMANEQVIIDKIQKDCNVGLRTVQRWMLNRNQPSLNDLVRTVSILQGFDATITMDDCYIKPNPSKKLSLSSTKLTN